MTDAEIIDMATVRLKYLIQECGFQHGEFDILLNTHMKAVAIVHDGKIQYITVHDDLNNFRRKVKP